MYARCKAHISKSPHHGRLSSHDLRHADFLKPFLVLTHFNLRLLVPDRAFLIDANNRVS